MRGDNESRHYRGASRLWTPSIGQRGGTQNLRFIYLDLHMRHAQGQQHLIQEANQSIRSAYPSHPPRLRFQRDSRCRMADLATPQRAAQWVPGGRTTLQQSSFSENVSSRSGCVTLRVDCYINRTTSSTAVISLGRPHAD